MRKLAVVVRPDLTEESVATGSPRSTEYTIWSEAVPGFGLRIRPTGVKTYIVMFRISGRNTQGKITLGKPGNLPLDLAKRLAREARIEALAGNDPRTMHKSGELLKHGLNDSSSVSARFPRITPKEREKHAVLFRSMPSSLCRPASHCGAETGERNTRTKQETGKETSKHRSRPPLNRGFDIYWRVCMPMKRTEKAARFYPTLS